MRVSEVLELAANAVEAEKPSRAWCNHSTCADSKICQAADGPSSADASSEFFSRFLGFDGERRAIWQWNDKRGRKQAEVVAKLREAASAAREQGQ